MDHLCGLPNKVYIAAMLLAAVLVQMSTLRTVHMLRCAVS